MNIDLKVRSNGKTIFRAKQLPIEIGIDSLNTLAKKYGKDEFTHTFEKITKDIQKEHYKQIRKYKYE